MNLRRLALRILAINPMLLRHQSLGACEQDRLTNVDDLIRMGHDVRLLTFENRHRSSEESAQFYAMRDLSVRLVPHTYQRLAPRRLKDIALFDGAAWEYAQPNFVAVLLDELQRFQPDLVWVHATYTWYPAQIAQQHGYRTVVRSVNNEAAHYLMEHGDERGIIAQARFRLKQLSEQHALQSANVMAAITPDEAAGYRKMNPHTNTEVLPLRALPNLLRPARDAHQHTPLHVFMMGATYNVSHNRAALAFVIEDIIPRIRENAPDTFVFHFLGSKFPEELLESAADDLVFEGFVDDLDSFLAQMDIALAPSIFGQGMQQKVFEPLCRAFPTLTHTRALAGYPLVAGKHVLTADDGQGFADALLQLRDPDLRASLSQTAAVQTSSLFSRTALDTTVETIIEKALHA